MPQDRVHDVAIVGFGPVGATLTHLLAQQGLSVLLLDREAAAYHLPRAGANPRRPGGTRRPARRGSADPCRSSRADPSAGAESRPRSGL